MLNTPATRLAGVLQAPAGQLARVFGAYAKRDEASGAGAETHAGGGLSDHFRIPQQRHAQPAGKSALQESNRSLD